METIAMAALWFVILFYASMFAWIGWSYVAVRRSELNRQRRAALERAETWKALYLSEHYQSTQGHAPSHVHFSMSDETQEAVCSICGISLPPRGVEP